MGSAELSRGCFDRAARRRGALRLAALIGLALWFQAMAGTNLTADVLRFEAVRDVWISAVDDEIDDNMGAAETLKLKVWQEFALLDFDLARLEGKEVRSAFLFLKPAGGDRLGLNHGTDLRWLTISTIAHPWVEGASRRYGRDTRGFGATFRESSYSKQNWGWEGARVWDVILGNGNTLRMDGQIEPTDDGWFRIELDPTLVSAMVAGASYGIAVMDGSTEIISNCLIWSRESGQGPFLEIRAEATPLLPVPAVEELRLTAAPARADLDSGAVQASFEIPDSAFAYDVWLNGTPLSRWQIPFAGRPGTTQVLTIEGLPADSEQQIAVVVRDGVGSRSPPVVAKGKSSSPFFVPHLAKPPFHPLGGEPPQIGDALLWALPELTEIDPVTAQPLFERLSDNPRRRNAVWDASEKKIRLAAARGEIVSFQVVVEGRATHCSVRPTALTGPSPISADRFRLWRNWYVGRQSEYALPLASEFDVPPEDTPAAGQRLQAITVDLPVPTELEPETYRGTLTVECVEGLADLALELQVYDVVIPDEVHFNIELNCYKGPGRAGSDRFIASFQLAHYHRATINRVPYSHFGEVNTDWAPEIDAEGRVIAWDRFDRNLGGLLDGSWFADNPRSSVPVPVLYLPLFEGWPLDFRQHYDPGQGVPVRADDRLHRLEHDSKARPLDKALSAEFQRTFVDAVAAFRLHFQELGWNRTVFQFYLNNKPDYGYTLWSLDEPFKYLDWAALNVFGELFKLGIEDPETYTTAWQSRFLELGLAEMSRDRPTMLFRADVSRPMWQGSVSDGVVQWMYVGGIGLQMPTLLREMRSRAPMMMNLYGSVPSVDEDNWQAAAWPMAAFLHHFEGVLPWQSLGGPGALRVATQNALLIDGGNYGPAIASLRLHALRRGAQDCELLRLLQLRTGWSREQLALVVRQKLPFPESTSAGDYLELKEGVLQLLEGFPATPSSAGALPDPSGSRRSTGR